jgi:hypothetical protein
MTFALAFTTFSLLRHRAHPVDLPARHRRSAPLPVIGGCQVGMRALGLRFG